MQTNVKCFYHKVDLDGFCSAAIVKLFHPGCELFPIAYEDTFPWDKVKSDDVVYMVDFSLPVTEMKRLVDFCQVIWCDHHITRTKPAAESGINPKGLRGNDKAGCLLTWEYFANNFPQETKTLFGSLAPPQVVKYLSAYDLGKKDQYPGVVPFQYAFRAFSRPPENNDFWRKVLQEIGSLGETMINRGFVILNYLKKDLERLIRLYSFKAYLPGFTALCLNDEMSSGVESNPIDDQHELYDLFITFLKLPGGLFKLTVASNKPGIHCGNICQHLMDTDPRVRDGGGHEHIAGMVVTELPWVEGLKPHE